MSTWIAYIVNPKTKRARRRIIRSKEDASMGNTRVVAIEAARRFGVSVDHVLALPKRGKILRRRKRRSKHRRSR
jgi:hypothetical protein